MSLGGCDREPPVVFRSPEAATFAAEAGLSLFLFWGPSSTVTIWPLQILLGHQLLNEAHGSQSFASYLRSSFGQLPLPSQNLCVPALGLMGMPWMHCRPVKKSWTTSQAIVLGLIPPLMPWDGATNCTWVWSYSKLCLAKWANVSDFPTLISVLLSQHSVPSWR